MVLFPVRFDVFCLHYPLVFGKFNTGDHDAPDNIYLDDNGSDGNGSWLVGRDDGTVWLCWLIGIGSPSDVNGELESKTIASCGQASN